MHARSRDSQHEKGAIRTDTARVEVRSTDLVGQIRLKRPSLVGDLGSRVHACPARAEPVTLIVASADEDAAFSIS